MIVYFEIAYYQVLVIIRGIYLYEDIEIINGDMSQRLYQSVYLNSTAGGGQPFCAAAQRQNIAQTSQQISSSWKDNMTNEVIKQYIEWKNYASADNFKIYSSV